MQGLNSSVATVPDQAIKAHFVADAAEGRRLQTLSLRKRGELLEAACAAAAEIERSRLAAGLAKTEPAP